MWLMVYYIRDACQIPYLMFNTHFPKKAAKFGLYSTISLFHISLSLRLMRLTINDTYTKLLKHHKADTFKLFAIIYLCDLRRPIKHEEVL